MNEFVSVWYNNIVDDAIFDDMVTIVLYTLYVDPNDPNDPNVWWILIIDKFENVKSVWSIQIMIEIVHDFKLQNKSQRYIYTLSIVIPHQKI